MFLSDFSIKRPTATIVLILAMMCVGLLALKKLRVNQNPDVEVPFIVVSIPYPGASPDTVEREVVNRLEKSLQSISGVTEVNTIGGFEKQYHVRPAPMKLISYGISFRDVMEALATNNMNVGGGYIEHAGEQYTIRATGQILGIDDIRNFYENDLRFLRQFR